MNLKEGRKRKRDDDRPATVVAIAQARKGRSHNAALLVDYARRIKEIESYFLKYKNDFASSLNNTNTKLDLIELLSFFFLLSNYYYFFFFCNS